MQYTLLGATGVTVSRICLGCMSYGSSGWRPWVLDEKESLPFFRRAVEAGETITYSVTPIYHGDELIPRGITISAHGSNGFRFQGWRGSRSEFNAITLLNRSRP